MTDVPDDSAGQFQEPGGSEPDAAQDEGLPPFIVYQDGDRYNEELDVLITWVHQLLIPVYGRELGSSSLWCTMWWQHAEAVAQLHALWLAWHEYTGVKANLSGPSIWHRDFLAPTMSSLRGSDGPFAGCKPGVHRAKEQLPVAVYTP